MLCALGYHAARRQIGRGSPLKKVTSQIRRREDMKRIVCCLMLFCTFSLNAAFAQAGAKAKAKSAEKKTGSAKPASAKEAPATLAEVLGKELKRIEGDFVPLADAMPEDKYDFAPTNGEFKGVRTFSQQVKHVAQTNFALAS